MLKRQGSHYAPMRKGWLLLAFALLAVAGGAAVAGGLGGAPDGGRVQLRSVSTTLPESPLDEEPTTTTSIESTVEDGAAAVADGVGSGSGTARTRTAGPSTTRSARVSAATTTTAKATTTTVDPDAAEEAAEEEERRLEEEEEAREDAEREARRQAD